MAYDNLAQQMAKKKVAPDAAWPILGGSAGGSPHVFLHWHPTDHQITQAGPRFSTPRGRVPSAGVGGRATCCCSLTSSTTAVCNWSSSVQATWRRSIARSLIYSTSRAVRVAMTPLPAPPLVAWSPRAMASSIAAAKRWRVSGRSNQAITRRWKRHRKFILVASLHSTTFYHNIMIDTFIYSSKLVTVTICYSTV
jgi:hypothetical protein